MTEQDLMELCHANKVNVDLLTGYDVAMEFQYGVRLRPWKQGSRPEMIIAKGETLLDAIQNACNMAEKGRWEELAWEKRPWTPERRTSGTWR